MSVVVSDTSPLHYLILCGAEEILPHLFLQVVIPPTVLRELQQSNTPDLVKQWATTLPSWVSGQQPTALNLKLEVDAGELEAICLAKEINAAAILMDDRAGRAAALQSGLALVGTIGLLEKAATRGLVELPDIIDRLQKTNARLDPELISAVLERDLRRGQSRS